MLLFLFCALVCRFFTVVNLNHVSSRTTSFFICYTLAPLSAGLNGKRVLKSIVLHCEVFAFFAHRKSYSGKCEANPKLAAEGGEKILRF